MDLEQALKTIPALRYDRNGKWLSYIESKKMFRLATKRTFKFYEDFEEAWKAFLGEK